MSNQAKKRVGILGATGLVGQRLVHMLRDHPMFELTAVAASDRSEGRPYREACNWKLPYSIPDRAGALDVVPCAAPLECDFVISSLPTDIATETEMAFAAAGYPVISNSSSHRMGGDIPLIVPEINPDHTDLIAGQQQSRGWDRGYIVTNPNCSTIALVFALAPLDRAFGLEAVMATTMQAISGAGYPGVASIDITDNVVPFIKGEEEKVEIEPRKILGKSNGSQVELAAFAVSAQCNRVNVQDGHMIAVRAKLFREVTIDEAREALASFRGVPQDLALHSAPKHPIVIRDEADRPQPRLDRDAEGGMATIIGRIERDSIFDLKFTVLGHNTIRGAAGAALLNAELLVAKGLL